MDFTYEPANQRGEYGLFEPVLILLEDAVSLSLVDKRHEVVLDKL